MLLLQIVLQERKEVTGTLVVRINVDEPVNRHKTLAVKCPRSSEFKKQPLSRQD